MLDACEALINAGESIESESAGSGDCSSSCGAVGKQWGSIRVGASFDKQHDNRTVLCSATQRSYSRDRHRSEVDTYPV